MIYIFGVNMLSVNHEIIFENIILLYLGSYNWTPYSEYGWWENDSTIALMKER